MKTVDKSKTKTGQERARQGAGWDWRSMWSSRREVGGGAGGGGWGVEVREAEWQSVNCGLMKVLIVALVTFQPVTDPVSLIDPLWSVTGRLYRSAPVGPAWTNISELPPRRPGRLMGTNTCCSSSSRVAHWSLQLIRWWRGHLLISQANGGLLLHLVSFSYKVLSSEERTSSCLGQNVKRSALQKENLH